MMADMGSEGPEEQTGREEPGSAREDGIPGEAPAVRNPAGHVPSDDGPLPSGRSSPGRSIEEYTSREIGAEGERLAASYLQKRGFEVLERNWRCSAGEVDVVAREGSTTVLAEVKTRLALGESSEGMPELAVDRRKQQRYRKLALLYLASHPEVSSVRFDVVAINIVGERCARLRHLIGAFEWDD